MRDSFRSLPLLLLGVMFIVFGIVFSPTIGLAQENGEEEETVEEIIPVGVPPLSPRVGLLSFPLSTQPASNSPSFRSQRLVELKVQFEDRTEGRVGLDVFEDFLPLTEAALTSGIAIFRETGVPGFQFQVGDQNSDTPINLSEAPTVEPDPIIPGKYTVTFRFNPNDGNVQLPFIQDKIADFHVVAQTSLQIMHGDRFEVSIPANGITIVDRFQPLPDNTYYDVRFPHEDFAQLDPSFAIPAIFEGDIVQLSTPIQVTNNTHRVDRNSEPKTILGIDVAGREDQGYFLNQLRLNFISVNLETVAALISHMTLGGGNFGGFGGFGGINTVVSPSFFYSPWFYNFPTDAETGETLMGETIIPDPDGGDPTVIEYPLTMPLNFNGFPRESFIVGNDNRQSHVTSYTPFGPKGAFGSGLQGLVPKLVTPDILKPLNADGSGGVILYRDLGGVEGQYDPQVDRAINLNQNLIRPETLLLDPEEVTNPNSPLHSLVRRLLPGLSASDAAKNVLPFLFQDSNLGATLLGVPAAPAPAEGPRPPYGSLECYLDPDCFMLDQIINVFRPYLGLTEGQIRYLADYTGDNGRTNMEDLYGVPQLVFGFSYLLNVSSNNALADMRIPTSRSGSNFGPDFYIAIRTSENLSNLDSFIPFVRPGDIQVGTQLNTFVNQPDAEINSLRSVSSIGWNRPNTGNTVALIGRPRPVFQFNDLTIPGEGANSGNNNIIFDRSLDSPPKAVIGMNVQDFGQNSSLVTNVPGFSPIVFEEFFSESTVLGEMQIEVIPGPNSINFGPEFLSPLPIELNVFRSGAALYNEFSIAIYEDDDTPTGDGIDNDGDGLVDEEYFNLQDDDGDGLIDEDLGDQDPAGINGVFDELDNIMPFYFDRHGAVVGVGEAQYVWEPNPQDLFTDFLDVVAGDTDLALEAGDYLPIGGSTGGFFAHIDMRVLNFTNYQMARNILVPGTGTRPFNPGNPPFYNQGAFPRLDPRTGLIDLFSSVNLPEFPLYPEDLFIEDPVSGDQIWMLTLGSDNENSIPVLQDPDGDARRSFSLSLIRALRIPNPSQVFLRTGHNPVVVDVVDPDLAPANAQDPQGQNITEPLALNQFGWFLEFADANAIGDYLESIADTIGQGLEDAQTAIDDFNEAVADAIADCDADEECTEPDFPELPEAIAVEITTPYSALNFDAFLEDGGPYATNYMYQNQIPDADFGPRAGNDFYVVMRTSPEAQVGDSFRVRIRPGILNNSQIIQDADDGPTPVAFPERGVGYHSFIDPEFSFGRESFRNVSKNTVTTSEIFVRSQNVAPSFQFISPGPGRNLANADFMFDISFVAEDPDNVAQVQLFIDDNKQDFDGTFIPGATLTSLDTSFQLNLREAIPNFDPTQSYYVYARVSDGVNQPLFVYSDGPITTIVGEQGGPGGGTGGSISVRGQLQNRLDYVKFAGDGRFFSLGEAPGFADISSTTRIIDIEPTQNFSGALAVTTTGNVLVTGDVGVFLNNVAPNNTIVFPARETAFYRNSTAGGELIISPTATQITLDRVRDMEVDYINQAIYILDGDGDMLFLGANANTNLVPPGLGMDLYRDMELSPSGNRMFFLAGNGLFFEAGAETYGPLLDIVEDDIYRDIELIVDRNTVTGLVITDADGNLTGAGSGSSLVNLPQYDPLDEITPGNVIQVKTFPGLSNTLVLLEGGGELHYLTTHEELPIPDDEIVFAEAGLNGAIVDLETTSFNLRGVQEVVQTILSGFGTEDPSKILPYLSPNYKDVSGADAAGVAMSLDSLFSFFEILSYSESRSLNDYFTITNQGDTVVAQVWVDFVTLLPSATIYSIVDDLDAGALFPETFILLTGTIPFNQTLAVREVGDGRGWTITFFSIKSGYRNITDLLDTDELEIQDYLTLRNQGILKKFLTYGVRSREADPYVYITIEQEPGTTNQNLVLMLFEENNVNYDVTPPIVEVLTYTGGSTSIEQFSNMTFRFRRNAENEFELVSMNNRFILFDNDGDFTLGETGELPGSIIGEIPDSAEFPSGFRFDRRGPVATYLRGDADFVFQEDRLQPTNDLGAVMMLPEGTDIFSIEPQSLINSLSLATVRNNPYDPAVTAGDLDIPNSSSMIVDRSYLVIDRTGKRFGFVKITPESQAEDAAIQNFIVIEYRYENSFVLPPNF